MNPFVAFMASGSGRMLRIVAGLAIIAAGLMLVRDTAGIIVAMVGTLPLLAGLFDFCVFAPLFGNPFRGAKIRAGK